ncbi:glutaredoxin-C10-like [Syzygium oleosum]|uniref:glutaredoxin-C10-like n=1 Tax=Syzygium oleosum TaxID=219896 RepID=UPI0011D1E8BC|nr:glutaredoxin-C10-like [Syzygium oleosum]
MQGVQRRRCSNEAAGLDLSAATATATTTSSASASASTASLSIDEAEPAEARIQRLISEHPVIIFSRSSCCMCHVMKKLLGTIGVHPTVIELDDDEICSLGDGASTPSAFIGGSPVGGLDSLFALHLSGRLIPMLVAVGALYNHPIPS